MALTGSAVRGVGGGGAEALDWLLVDGGAVVLPGEHGEDFAGAVAAPCAVVGMRVVVFVLVVEVAEGVQEVGAGA